MFFKIQPDLVAVFIKKDENVIIQFKKFKGTSIQSNFIITAT